MTASIREFVIGQPLFCHHGHEQTIAFLQEHGAPPETLEWSSSGLPPEPRPVPPEGRMYW